MAQPEQYFKSRRIAEGGLSRNPKDHASANPAPCSYKGLSGWHTNMGITYPTWLSIGKAVGLKPTCQNFFTITPHEWELIFDEIWRRAGGYDINNTALANIVFQSRWGSGEGGALHQLGKDMKALTGVQPKTFQGLAALINQNSKTPEDAKKLFDYLWNKRNQFYIDLNQPEFEKGWLKDWKKFYGFNQQYLVPGAPPVTVVNYTTPATEGSEAPPPSKKNKNLKYIIIGGTLFLIGVGTVVAVRHHRKNKRINQLQKIAA